MTRLTLQNVRAIVFSPTHKLVIDSRGISDVKSLAISFEDVRHGDKGSKDSFYCSSAVEQQNYEEMKENERDKVPPRELFHALIELSMKITRAVYEDYNRTHEEKAPSRGNINHS